MPTKGFKVEHDWLKFYYCVSNYGLSVFLFGDTIAKIIPEEKSLEFVQKFIAYTTIMSYEEMMAEVSAWREEINSWLESQLLAIF